MAWKRERGLGGEGERGEERSRGKRVVTERLEGRDLQTPAPRGEARARENEQGRAKMDDSVRPANTMAVPTGRCCMAWKASSERGILLRRYVNLPIIKRGCCTHIKCGNVVRTVRFRPSVLSQKPLGVGCSYAVLAVFPWPFDPHHLG
jgi:hypothetical protein